MLQCTPHLVSKHWVITPTRADTRLLDMYERHYSCYQYKDGRTRTQGIAPGQYTALMTAELDALFVWTKQKYRADKQRGVNCAVFRNESSVLSSTLIREAMAIAWQRWPMERLFTFVDPMKIQSANPGYCFKVAGWDVCGKTKRGLIILEARP